MEKHEVVMQALSRIRCCCGWFWHNDCLKGKSDEDLLFELRHEFNRHVVAMRSQGF